MKSNIYYRDFTGNYGGRICWGCGKHGKMLDGVKVIEVGFRHSLGTVLLCQQCLNETINVLKEVSENGTV